MTEVVVRLQLEYPSGLAPEPSAVITADMPLLYKICDAARLLAVGESAIYELIAQGELESVKIGASRRITRAGIEAYVRRIAGGTGDVA